MRVRFGGTRAFARTGARWLANSRTVCTASPAATKTPSRRRRSERLGRPGTPPGSGSGCHRLDTLRQRYSLAPHEWQAAPPRMKRAPPARRKQEQSAQCRSGDGGELRGVTRRPTRAAAAIGQSIAIRCRSRGWCPPSRPRLSGELSHDRWHEEHPTGRWIRTAPIARSPLADAKPAVD